MSGQIEITINGKSYPIACDAGEEERVEYLASYVDAKFNELAKSFGKINELHLFSIVALMLADELLDANEELAKQRQQSPAPSHEEDVSEAIENMAARLENLAESIEKE
jgi:cell division protein ZapA